MRASGVLGLTLLASGACLLLASAAQDDAPAWLTDVDAAFRLAHQEQRPILAVLH
jgi:hypothetical protein